MGERYGFADTGRTILEMVGSDARAVLQGIVTNDVDRLGEAGCLYAALLTPQGKYLFDFFLLDGEAGGVLIDVASSRADALMTRMKMYCLRRDAKLERRDDLGVALVWTDGAEPLEEPEGSTVVIDPRSAALGWRVYGSDVAASLAALGIETRARADYDALRVSHIVPETDCELVPEESFILEMGFERLSGVDFRKGCYVGQEVTARMKHKATLRKGLVAVGIAGEAETGAQIMASGKPAGTLFSRAGGQALALLRLDRAGPDMQAGEAEISYEA